MCGRSLKDIAFPSAIMESMWQAQSKIPPPERQYLLMMLALIVVSSVLASQHASAMDVDIERFLWKKRLLLIFSLERADPLFNSLINEISSRRGDVEDRDLVIFEILESGASKMNSSELEPQKAASFRERFEIPETTFTVILLGKDGGIKLKRKDHVRLEDIFLLIDSMPMRQDEMRQKGL